MTPLVAAVWSCAPGAAMRYPARYLFVFLDHHGMLSVFGSPTWRTVAGGSATYVERCRHAAARSRPPAGPCACTGCPDGVVVTRGVGSRDRFDAAVIATHPDQALLMLAEPTAAERDVLGAIPYSTNHAQLHTDETGAAAERRARASWNYLSRPEPRPRRGCHLRRHPADAAVRAASDSSSPSAVGTASIRRP